MKCNCLISTDMRYNPCFSGYDEIDRSHKLYNKNIERSQSLLYKVLGKTNVQQPHITISKWEEEEKEGMRTASKFRNSYPEMF